jgi:glycosyltransferase involved in cell wall biosynthesis
MTRAQEPIVTICIPLFNRERLVSATLDSLFAQTFQEWEAVIVDDGSTDLSMQVIADYAKRDPRIKLLTRHRGPKGACTCRNIAVESGEGRYVLFLDTDDLLAPYCLEQRVRVLEAESETDFAIFPMFLFRGNPEDADRLWNVETGDDDLIRLLRLDPICQGTGTLWRKDAFVRAGMWNESLSVWQDIEFHLRAFAGDFHYVKRFDLPPDVYLRESDSSLSRGSYQSREKLESRAAVTRMAAQVLRASRRADLLGEVRYFCSSVALGATGSNNLDIARDIRQWGLREGVLTSEEARALRTVELARISRFDRLERGRRIREAVARRFSAPSTVGPHHVVPQA